MSVYPEEIFEFIERTQSGKFATLRCTAKVAENVGLSLEVKRRTTSSEKIYKIFRYST